MDKRAIEYLVEMLQSSVSYQVSNNIRIDCPLAESRHNKRVDGRQSMSIEISPDGRSRCICFACGTKGLLLYVMQQAHKIGAVTDDVISYIAANDKTGIEASMARLKADRLGTTDKPSRDFHDLEGYISRCKRTVPSYVIDRGLLKRDIDKWEIGYDAETCRAVLPIRDEDGKLIGATRRAVLPDVVPTYHDTPGLPKTSIFYGEHFIDRTIGRGHLVEGPFDVVFASRYLPNVIGALGAKTGLSRGQYSPVRLGKLKKWFRELIILYDGDEAGRQAVFGWWDARGQWVNGLRECLRPHLVVRVGTIPDGFDPAGLGGTIRNIADNAQYFISYKRPQYKNNWDLTRQPKLYNIGGAKFGN